MRGRKPKCLGFHQDSDKINVAYGIKREDVDIGWDDAGYYCITLCPRLLECIDEAEHLEKGRQK